MCIEGIVIHLLCRHITCLVVLISVADNDLFYKINVFHLEISRILRTELEVTMSSLCPKEMDVQCIVVPAQVGAGVA